MTLDDLICKMECQDLILRHARHLDAGELAESRTVYTHDAIIVGPTGQEIRQADIPDERLKQVTANLRPRIVTNIMVTPTSLTTAKAFAYVTLPRAEIPQGEWHYDLCKLDQGWRISRFGAVGIERDKGGAGNKSG